MKDFRDMAYLMTFVLVVILTFATCAGCSLKRSSAQQSEKHTLEPRATVAVNQPIAVDQVDLDRDGTISATERQSLMGDQPGVIPTFATIIGLVLFASIMSAWASARWAPKQPKSATKRSGEQLLTEQTHDRKRE